MKAPEGYRFERGLMWPDYDSKCAKVVFNMARDLDAVMKYVPKNRRKAVVQAGGNCGVWPLALAPLFEVVHTFEPDPRNYKALEYNVREFLNVTPYNMALGEREGVGRMFTPLHELDNCGALQFDPANVFDMQATVRVGTIDDFGFPFCDLLYLDIEGFEIPALRGASYTIDRHRPVIALEDKGLSERYGFRQGAVEKWLAGKGYRVAERIHRDIIFAPA